MNSVDVAVRFWNKDIPHSLCCSAFFKFTIFEESHIYMLFFFSLFCDPIGGNLLLFDVEMSLKHSHSELPDLSQKCKRGRKRKVPFKLVFFSLSSVTAATENFSDANKLGEGGFGPVYKVPT